MSDSDLSHFEHPPSLYAVLGAANAGGTQAMTIVMTPGQRYVLDGARCRIEWQGLRPDDDVTARLVPERGAAVVFPRDPVTGLRPQLHAPRGTWLLDLTTLGSE